MAGLSRAFKNAAENANQRPDEKPGKEETMCTLKMELTVALMVFTSCAMERTSATRTTLVSKTAPETVETGGRRSILREASARDTVLRVRLQSYTQCRRDWDETFQRTRIITERPDLQKCGGVTGWIALGSIFAVVGTAIVIAAGDLEPSEDPSGGPPPGVNLDDFNSASRKAWYVKVGGGIIASTGLVALSIGITKKIYCSQEPKITEKNRRRYTERQYGEAYNCGWKALQDVDVGVMLASGVVIRASTDEEGMAYFDLAGADPEDTAKMTLYVPQYEIIDPVVLDPTERRLLEFALLPKQSAKLTPVYGEIKSKARHAAIACYESQFADNPVGGTITVSVEVAPSGRVRRLSGDFDPGSLSVANACLWDKLADLQFEPWQGEALAVRVPVNFEAPPPPVVLPQREPEAYFVPHAGARERPLPPAPAEPKKKVETVLVGGTPVVFVHDPSLGCTAGVAACQAAITTQGGCDLIKREARRAVGGLWGIVAGAAVGAVCDQQMQEICAKVVCGD